MNKIKLNVFIIVFSILSTPLIISEFVPYLKSVTLYWYYGFLMFIAFGLFAILFLIAIVLIIFLPKNKKHDLLPSIKFTSATFLILFCAMLIKFIIPDGLPPNSYKLKFESANWLDSTSILNSNGGSVREKMLGDLVDNILPGKSKADIIDLLGPSLETDYFKSVKKDLIYYMGSERGHYINIDSEWLLIWLDNKGVFKKYAIYND